MVQIGPRIMVPANSSRLFSTSSEALEQPLGAVQLISADNLGYLSNSAFDSAKIRYDLNYCTSNIFHFFESKIYIRDLLPKLSDFTNVLEIGCGQGEFVEFLSTLGFNTFGFDPVIRKTSGNLFDCLWTIENESLHVPQIAGEPTLYLMRCVLPHIPNPFVFLDSIFDFSPNSAVLVEFQRREWIHENGIWPQISHDHVNIFSVSDFSSSYQVLNSGIFAEGEWAYVLLKKMNFVKEIYSESFESHFDSIFEIRDRDLSFLAEQRKRIAIYGAAGKGIVFGYTLYQAGIGEVLAIDDDQNRHGLFMDGSGIMVLPAEEAFSKLERGSLIVVMNPNHLSKATKLFQDKFSVKSIGKLI